jgi:broad specificity phosphatase PhoE
MTVEYEPGKLTWAFYHTPTRELLTSPEVRALGGKWYTHPAFEGTRFEEGVDRVRKETDKLMLSLGYRHDAERSGYIAENPTNERVALFAHQGFGLLFLSTLLDIPYNDFCTRFDIGHTGVTVIEFSAPKGEFCIPRVLQHSNDSHLYKEGLGTKYQNEKYI